MRGPFHSVPHTSGFRVPSSPSPAHPFTRRPHRTLVALSLPVLFSLVAEPVTGLVDTAFVAQLGSEALAGLGVGTILLSGVFWIFNFLGIGTQTEVARAEGQGTPERLRDVSGLALTLAGGFGILLLLAGLPLTGPLVSLMGADGALHGSATTYVQIRWVGAPAVLITVAAFGTLRGLQDMRTPLWIALSLNVLNVGLDAVLIEGVGPVPAFGIAGAAWASVAGQWFGAFGAAWAVVRRHGWPSRLNAGDARRLLRVGGDLFVRTGLLTLFLLLTTRAATRIGADAGAAHQAIRQVWMFTALFLDAFAVTGQSLVAYFRGAAEPDETLRVARLVCLWSLGTGVVLGLAMWLGTPLVNRLFVPATAAALFVPAWQVAACSQPLNALTFATDGLHWGTGDFRFLRNVVLLATTAGSGGLFFLRGDAPGALTIVWMITAGWISLRAFFGVARIWPGLGRSPWQAKASA